MAYSVAAAIECSGIVLVRSFGTRKLSLLRYAVETRSDARWSDTSVVLECCIILLVVGRLLIIQRRAFCWRTRQVGRWMVLPLTRGRSIAEIRGLRHEVYT